MPTVYIQEYEDVAVLLATVGQAGQEPANAAQTVPVGLFSARSEPFKVNTRLIRVHTDTTCAISIKANPAASNLTMRLPANTTEFFGVLPGHRLAANDGSADTTAPTVIGSPGSFNHERTGAVYPSAKGEQATASDANKGNSYPLEVKLFPDATWNATWGDTELAWATAAIVGANEDTVSIHVTVTQDPGFNDAGYAIDIAVRDAAGNFDYAIILAVITSS